MAIDSLRSTASSVSFDSTAETTAAGGAAPPAPAAAPAETGKSTVTAWSAPASSASPADVEGLLSRSWDDWFITGADVGQAMAKLQSMPPATFRDTVDALSHHDKLGPLLDAGGGQRAAFLSLCADKGLLEKVPGHTSDALFFPPASPDLYQESVHLPSELNDAIHDETMVAAGRYAGEYADYQRRYASAVGRCTSGEELRSLGPHEPPKSFHELTDPKDPGTRSYQREWNGHAVPSEGQAGRAVHAKLAELNKAHADDWVEGKVKLETPHTVHTVSFDSGSAEQKLKAADGVVVHGDHVEAEAMTDGERKLKAHAAAGSVTAIAKDGRLESVGAEVRGWGATVQEERVTFQAPVLPGITARSWADPESGGAGASLTVGAELHGLGEVSVTVGFGTRGLSRAEAREVTSDHEGVFDRPRELSQKTGWRDLSPEARARHEKNGWTEREWTRALR